MCLGFFPFSWFPPTCLEIPLIPAFHPPVFFLRATQFPQIFCDFPSFLTTCFLVFFPELRFFHLGPFSFVVSPGFPNLPFEVFFLGPIPGLFSQALDAFNLRILFKFFLDHLRGAKAFDELDLSSLSSFSLFPGPPTITRV